MIFEALNQLNEKVELSKLCKMGVLSPRIYCWREMYMKYTALIASGNRSMEAKRIVSDEMNVTVRTVSKAINFMRS